MAQRPPQPEQPRPAPAGAGAVHRERDPLRAYPPSLTYLDLIRRNKRESVLLMFGVVLLAVLVGAAISATVQLAFAADPVGRNLDVGFSYFSGDFDRMERAIERSDHRQESLGETLLPSVLLGALVATIIAALACSWSWFGGDKAILRMAGAHPIEKKDDPQLFNVVEELSIAAGLPMPRVYLIHSRALNAFATGRDPKHASVAITTGLRAHLNRDELAGVMAHEIAHIRHFDVRFAMLMATLVGLIVFACDAFLRISFYSRHAGVGRSGGGGGRGGKGQGGALILMMLIAIILAVIAPLLATLMQMAISRRREYLADAGAVELTRYPEGLASALQKLSDCNETLKAGNRATEHLFIVNPSKKSLRTKHRRNSLFSTHPPIQERVNRLLALTR